MRDLIVFLGFVAIGVGLVSGAAFCALALSDGRLVIAMVENPVRVLGLPALFGGLAGCGAYVVTRR